MSHATGRNAHRPHRERRPRGGGVSLATELCGTCGGWGEVLVTEGHQLDIVVDGPEDYPREVCPSCDGMGVRQ